MTGASVRFGRTLLSASHKIFLTSVMTSRYNHQATGLASDATKKVNPRVNIELYEMREDATKKEGHLYPVANPAALFFFTLPLSPVQCSSTTLRFLNQSLLSLFSFWKAVKFYPSSEIQTWNWSHSPQLACFSMQLLFFSFLSPVSSPSSTTVVPVPLNEQSNPQTRSITNSPPASPTTNVFVNNSLPLSAVHPESEDGSLRPTNNSRQNVRPVASRARHSSSQNHPKSVALYKQLRREHFVSRARFVKIPRFNRHLPYKLKLEFSSREISYWDSTRQEFTIKNNFLPSQRTVVPLRAITAHLPR